MKKQPEREVVWVKKSFGLPFVAECPIRFLPQYWGLDCQPIREEQPSSQQSYNEQNCAQPGSQTLLNYSARTHILIILGEILIVCLADHNYYV